MLFSRWTCYHANPTPMAFKPSYNAAKLWHASAGSLVIIHDPPHFGQRVASVVVLALQLPVSVRRRRRKGRQVETQLPPGRPQ